MNNLEQNKAIVRDLIDALAELDAERFLSHLSEDVMFETPGQFAAAGIKTKGMVAKEFPPMRKIMPDGLKMKIVTMTAEDNRVHVEIEGKAKTSGGLDYNNRYHYAIILKDGKIISFRDYVDSDLVMRVMVPEMEKHGMTIAGDHI
jgi:uncharacterized protein